MRSAHKYNGKYRTVQAGAVSKNTNVLSMNIFGGNNRTTTHLDYNFISKADTERTLVH